MYMPVSNNLSPYDRYEDRLLTREQIDEISARISRKVSENITMQLERALASSKKTKKEGNAAN